MSDRDFIPVLTPREAEDHPDQPPEVDPDADPSDFHALPALVNAAARILAFVGEWGDGRIDTANGEHLFARDLEVVARYAREATGE